MDLIKISAPSLDRPFGIELWPIFSKVFENVAGVPAEKFRFVPFSTPMSTLKETGLALLTYYVVIFGGRELMKKREAVKLNPIFLVHNFYLTAISGVLLALFIEQLLPTVVRHGIFFSICDNRGGWTPQLVTLYYLNYLTKYLELFDTVFLVLKKKPLTFLHTYHHGATALLCYTQLVGLTPISWVPITLNLTVHVVMYWYYFQSARGIRVWWKKYITIMQILQFVIDLGFVYFASYTYFANTYFPWAPKVGHCAGEEFAAIAGCVILSSYLVLFISFYFVTYRKETKEAKLARAAGGSRKRRNTATRATIDMARAEIPGGERIDRSATPPTAVKVSGRENGGSARVTRSRKA